MKRIWLLLAFATCHSLLIIQVAADKKYNNGIESKKHINKARDVQAVDLDYISPDKRNVLLYNTGKQKIHNKSRVESQQKNKARVNASERDGEKTVAKDSEEFLKLLVKTNNANYDIFNPEALNLETQGFIGPKLLRVLRKQIERLNMKLRDYTSEEYDDYDNEHKFIKTTKKPKLTRSRTKTRTRSKRPTRTKSRRTRTKRTRKTRTRRSHKTRPTSTQTKSRRRPMGHLKPMTPSRVTEASFDSFENWFTEPISYWTKKYWRTKEYMTTPKTTIIDDSISDDGVRFSTETSEHNKTWSIPLWAKGYFTLPSHKQENMSTPSTTTTEDTKISDEGYRLTSRRPENEPWSNPDCAKEYFSTPSYWLGHTSTPRATTIDDTTISNDRHKSTTLDLKYKPWKILDWAKEYFTRPSHWYFSTNTPRTTTIDETVISDNRPGSVVVLNPDNKPWKIPDGAEGYFTQLSHRYGYVRYIQKSFAALNKRHDYSRAVDTHISLTSEQIVKRLLTAVFFRHFEIND